jgi:hypothetical protein
LKVPEIYSRENWDTLASASHPEWGGQAIQFRFVFYSDFS